MKFVDMVEAPKYPGPVEASLAAKGYVAPPLNGVWASAPYFHNGSVPTLYHVLHPTARPTVWKIRDRDGYDATRVGLLVDEFEQIPSEAKYESERRKYFNSQDVSKSNRGHDFAKALSEDDINAVIEYLKTI